MSNPLVTVFTATIYPDLARLWHACVVRAFPPAEARIEIFQDSDDNRLDEELLPGAVLLRRAPRRREFHEAYNDALARCETPYLTFIDSDNYWVSPRLWERVKEDLEEPGVAAVSCVSRRKTASHGTFAVVMKAEIYRRVLAERLPDGFFPAIENLDPATPQERWVRYDTADLASRAVAEAGYEVRLLSLQNEEARGGQQVVRFRGITLSRRSAEWLGPGPLAAMARESRYFFRGYLGNLVLARLHDRLFADGPRYDFPYGRRPLLEASLGTDDLAFRRDYRRRLGRGARRIEAFVRSRPAPAPGVL